MAGNVKDYYESLKNLLTSGGNPNALNTMGSGQFNYTTLIQVLGHSPTGTEGLECFGSTLVHQLKSLGLIDPTLKREDFEEKYTTIHDAANSPDGISFDSKYNHDLQGWDHGRVDTLKGNAILDEIVKFQDTDWAKLTGMSEAKLEMITFKKDDFAFINQQLGNGWSMQFYTAQGTTYNNSSHYVTAKSSQFVNQGLKIGIDDPYRQHQPVMYDPNKDRLNWFIRPR